MDTPRYITAMLTRDVVACVPNTRTAVILGKEYHYRVRTHRTLPDAWSVSRNGRYNIVQSQAGNLSCDCYSLLDCIHCAAVRRWLEEQEAGA